MKYLFPILFSFIIGYACLAINETPVYDYSSLDFSSLTTGVISTTSYAEIFTVGAGDIGSEIVDSASCYGGSGKCMKFATHGTMVRRVYAYRSTEPPEYPDLFRFKIKFDDLIDSGKLGSFCWNFKTLAGAWSSGGMFGVQIEDDDIRFATSTCGIISTAGTTVKTGITTGVWYELKFRIHDSYVEFEIDNDGWQNFTRTGYDTSSIYSRMNIGHQIASNATYYYDDFNYYDVNITVSENTQATSTITIIDPSLYTGLCVSTPCASLQNNPKYCYYDSDKPCLVDFHYNDQFFGSTAYLVDVNEFPTGSEPQYSAFISDGGYAHLEAVNPGSATTTYHQIYFEIPDYGGYVIGSYMIEWVSISDIFPEDNITASCNCNNVATSTGIFDEFRYGIECGGTMLACWLFKPSAEASRSVLNSWTGDCEDPANYKTEGCTLGLINTFPISFIYGTKSAIESVQNATTTDWGVSIEAVADTQLLNDLDGMKLFDASDVEETVVYPLVSSIRTMFAWLVKLIFIAYIIFRIFTISGGKNHVLGFFKRNETQKV